jgi:ditrans,polycis-polyprenyl diphosphate synthase
MLNSFSAKIASMFKSLVSSVFKIGGHIPKSVAIIMDGNRRYAQKKKVEKIKGHEDGLNKLLQVLSWCIDLEVKELTVFAFSIDNFNRPKEEVDALMFLAREKFAKLSEKNEILTKYGVKVEFYGNLSYLDEEMQSIFNKMEEDTAINNVIKMNVCFPYNSSEEINNARNKINLETNIGSNIREEFEKCLYGGYNCSPDILIRTSGESRLSNFLLYQCRFSILYFVEKLWPDFSYGDFLKIILSYNINYTTHRRNILTLEKDNNYQIY